MNRHDLRLILIGALISSGLVLVIVGFFYKDAVSFYIQAKYIPPIFNIPEKVNRDFTIDVIDRTNIERKKVNLQPLKENSALSYAAYLRAKDILDNQDFSHVVSESGDIKAQKAVQIVGYRYSEVGENLAMGIDDPNEVVAGWLGSPEHKANLLSKDFKETGVAVLTGEFHGQKDTYIVVQLLGVK